MYIPWLSEAIKKRGVRYLLHHYLGQFFEEKLTLEQLSIDIYEGKGSIRNLALDVVGLNDELDFIPFKFLEGCLIGQISVEVPWSSLATDACRVELEGAVFVCRLKTIADGNAGHCTESTLLTRSLMTSSMQMAEDIVTNDDNDCDYESPTASMYSSTTATSSKNSQEPPAAAANKRKEPANQMFEGLEMFAQLIDSVLRRTKLTARNTLFQIRPAQKQSAAKDDDEHDDDDVDDEQENCPESADESDKTSPGAPSDRNDCNKPSTLASGDEEDDINEDEFLEGTNSTSSEKSQHNSSPSEGTVEFFIRFFRCEEIIDETRRTDNEPPSTQEDNLRNNQFGEKPTGAMPEIVTKLLTLEDVEMRIGGIPVSNLVGKHTIMIKFNGQKSEISIFSGSPLLAVINHEQLRTFFNVFDGKSNGDLESSLVRDKLLNQKMMSSEDYAKIENQLLESASLRTAHQQIHNLHMNDLNSFPGHSYHNSTGGISSQAGQMAGRRWVESGGLGGDSFSSVKSHHHTNQTTRTQDSDYFDYHSPNIFNSSGEKLTTKLDNNQHDNTTLDNIEAFSCELKLPGIWLCILRDKEALPPLIKPYADSINSFQSINKYIDQHIKVPHIRLLGLKVALDMTIEGINIFLGDLDISEHLQDDSMSPILHLLHNDQANNLIDSSRYKASIVNNREITISMLTKTRLLLDPTIIDRIVYDYKLVNLSGNSQHDNKRGNVNQEELDPDGDDGRPSANRRGSKVILDHNKKRNQLDLNISIKAQQFMVELLCPIPDLRPEAASDKTQLRPQSFLFDFGNIILTWQSDKLNVTSEDLLAYVKTQPQQSDQEAIKFIESINKNGNNKIHLTLEPSPSSLDTFPSDVEQALNESSMYDSIYVGQASESRLPTEAFQTKRRVVRGLAAQQQQGSSTTAGMKNNMSDCDNEKIVTPGDRQHLLDYLNQTVMATKLSLNLHLPICEVEFEDKEQLDLIYNRFGNDFVFWQPRALSESTSGCEKNANQRGGRKKSLSSVDGYNFKHPFQDDEEDENDSNNQDENDSQVSFHSLSAEGSSSEFYDNEVTCKITIDELYVKFNHQSCASAMKQEISVENLLLGVIIDVNKKPCTILSLVGDNLELSTDSDVVLEGNSFGDKNSIFALTADIRRPTKSLKDIKLAIQLVNGLFNDFKTDTFTRFWQSINVTDEPIMGYVAPKIVTELHIDILNTALSLNREGARPALISMDELYLTSMVVQQTSQVMIRLLADEVSLYLKRNKTGMEIMKNYVCIIDSGLVDLNVKFSDDGRLEFNVMNNMITVRACQDSLSALFKLLNVMIKSNNVQQASKLDEEPESSSGISTDNIAEKFERTNSEELYSSESEEKMDREQSCDGESEQLPEEVAGGKQKGKGASEMNLLEDAMNDFGDSRDSFPPSSNENSDDDHADDAESSSEDSPLKLQRAARERDPNACLLDESNPKLGSLFSTPLLPCSSDELNESLDSFTSSTTNLRPIDESGFFVIGNDDVGSGVIDKTQREPTIRKLVEGNMNIIENYFKMTKPRTIPEMLASSLERYVLEEMTLVVNLFGGRDFDEDESKEEANSNVATASEEQESESLDSASIESLSSRSRANSIASATNQAKKLTRKHTSSDSATSSSRKQQPPYPSSGAAGGEKRKGSSSRRKHLSEGSRDLYASGKAEVAGGSTVARVRFGEGAVNLWESLDLMSSPDFFGTSGARKHNQSQPVSSDSKLTGGIWRQTDVCIQLTLTKVKLLYELADYQAEQQLAAKSGASEASTAAAISWRFMLFINEIEIKDRIHASDINKLLYEYCTESMPRRNTQMLTIKNVATINPSDGCEECDLRVSLKPLRLNMDQDTLIFLIEFFTAFGKSLTKHQQQQQQQQQQQTASGARRQSKAGNKDQANRLSGDATGKLKKPTGACRQADKLPKSAASRSGARPGGFREPAPEIRSEKIRGGLSSAEEASSSCGPDNSAAPTTTTTTTTTSNSPGNSKELPTHCHSDGSVDGSGGPGSGQAIYIKSFTFSPDVPIRLDYHAKHLDFEQGALAGILMGLAHLDHSELVLRRVQAKHGMRGLDRVLIFTLNSWMGDIKRNQLPSILGGVGPMHSVIQLFQGMKDLVWMPIDHYRKDRRLVRGLQRGASSFSSSTAMAAINLMNRFISIVQCTAQIAHDIVTPPNSQFHQQQQRARRAGDKSNRSAGSGNRNSSNKVGIDGARNTSTSSISALNQPRNFCEGVAVGFNIIKEGFNDTARNVAVGMQAEDYRSAVGELVRQIPSTLLNPIITATEGAQNVLVGIRNQIAPDARKEDQEKWKRRVRGK